MIKRLGDVAEGETHNGEETNREDGERFAGVGDRDAHLTTNGLMTLCVTLGENQHFRRRERPAGTVGHGVD